MAVIDFAAVRKEADFLAKVLKQAGLPTDVGTAIASLARTIRDHKHFERILTEADPSERQDLYEAIVPHLRFSAKPLDVYVASAGREAEQKQLPILGPDGMLHEFRPATDVKTIEKVAEKAIAESLAKRTLTLTCAKCLRQESFFAVGDETRVAVVIKARKIGWIYDYLSDHPKEICPNCPTSLRSND